MGEEGREGDKLFKILVVQFNFQEKNIERSQPPTDLIVAPLQQWKT